ncbi:acyclic terpene utilization AtuA family protein [Tepidiphilus olei]|uniref:acyclic terpene utilization AtuA family protein n=1 Tax=Tepidiphilus olei TaxID=2502184 RepID=UPI00115D730D|nr:acyclic terpene utilization AtuA family protein [Tepidiphilus olei]
MGEKIVRIGGGAGYWGDTPSGPRQLVRQGNIDYLILDYLAEITMSILAKAKAKDPQAGYATDFITLVMKPLLREIAEKRIKVIANAGGVNLPACRHALEALAQEAGVRLRIGTVEGDDLLPRAGELAAESIREMFTGAPFPAKPMSINAYLGAFPIAAALDAGADVVLTGRCVDSALVAGPLIHEFGWGPQDYDKLAAAGLAGHLLECGAQATGGNFTDWEDVVDDWPTMGFPIAEVRADGSFVVTKPEGTGGCVSPLSVGEQMLYEIGDPAAYVLPDVICDFTGVRLRQIGPDRVEVTGVRGLPPTDTYKVCATYPDGFGTVGTLVLAGRDAVAKAQRYGEAILAKVRNSLEEAGLPPLSDSAIQLVGAESLYGPYAQPAARTLREVTLRVAVHHPSPAGIEVFSKEFMGAALAMSTGRTGLAPGRPKASPIVRLFSFLYPKKNVPVEVRVDGEALTVQHLVGGGGRVPTSRPGDEEESYPLGESEPVPLVYLAVARSGDKGNHANIGVIARRPEYLPWIRAALTPAAVRARFAHFITGKVERFDLPGIHGLNFLLHDTLGGGGVASLHLDPQAKTYAQLLLDMPIPVPPAMARLAQEERSHFTFKHQGERNV